MFEEILGGGAGGRGGRGRGGRGAGVQPTRGFDLETQVEITLEEVATGTEKTIEFPREEACSECHGSGARPGSSPVVCPACGGQGRVAQQGFGGMFRMVTTCPNCRGRGQIIRDHCPKCRGTGRETKKRVVKVAIPAGMHEGQGLRIANEGEPGLNNGPHGDLHCYLAIKQHPIFSRHNNDIVCQLPVSFAQAALGAKVVVPTLFGKEDLDIPQGTQHGEIFTLKGKGLPDIRSRRVGNELVQVMIEIPKKLTDKQRQLLKEYIASDDGAALPQRKSFLDKIRDKLAGDK
jgi:molecular chaperone DnaJ